MKIFYCSKCRESGVPVRELTQAEIALIGYEPENTLVCAECESLGETVSEEFEVHRLAREGA